MKYGVEEGEVGVMRVAGADRWRTCRSAASPLHSASGHARAECQPTRHALSRNQSPHGGGATLRGLSLTWSPPPQTGDFAGPRGLLLVMLSVAFKWAFPGDQVTAGAAGNTSLVCHAGRLLALSESCLPFQLGFADGRLHSVGNCTFEGQVKHAFTAHPKKDPRTGELVFFHYKCASLRSRGRPRHGAGLACQARQPASGGLVTR